MKKVFFCITLMFLLVAMTRPVHAADRIADKYGSLYLEGRGTKTGVILLHGRQGTPRSRVVEPLRIGLNKRLGFHTLSLQMPAEKKYLKEYPAEFPDAFERIKNAIAFLRAKGVKRIYLIGHSMGARMASAFTANNPDEKLRGLICIGLWNNGGPPLNGKESLERTSIPVLDIVGGGNKVDMRSAAQRAGLRSKHYRQVVIPDAPHAFTNYENPLVKTIVNWLVAQERSGK